MRPRLRLHILSSACTAEGSAYFLILLLPFCSTLTSNRASNSMDHDTVTTNCPATSDHKTGSEDVLSGGFAELSDLTPDPPKMREICPRCRRPTTVCICSCLPTEPIKTSTKVIILQHPSEIDRCLATVPLLQECLTKDRLTVIRGKRFNLQKQPLLQSVLSSQHTLLLYPSHNAIELSSISPPSTPLTLLVIDGTWAQARSMYTQNPFIQSIKQVKLSCTSDSEYVIRTQPSKHGLSTLESVAHAVAWLDGTPDIIEMLVRPLRALCQHQLDHGAVVHHSKDHPDYTPPEQYKKQQRKKTVF